MAELELLAQSLKPWPVLAILALAPVSALLNASELTLCARAVSRHLPLKASFAYSALGTVSNLLPFPASTAIRGGALLTTGATWQETTAILVTAGVMWLAMAAAISALAISPDLALGPIVGIGGAIVCVLLFVGIAVQAGIRIAVGFLLVRTVLLMLLVFRLWLAFLAINSDIRLVEGAYYAFAGIAGTVVSIVPAGLGISEGLAAMMAAVTGGSPAAAFLAFGLNRLLGFIVAGIIAASLRNHIIVKRT